MNPPLILLLVLIGIGTFIVLGTSLTLAANITKLSSHFKRSFAKTAKVGTGDFRFLRASPTLQWKMGGILVLSSSTFITTIDNVVISTILDLLVI